MNQEYRTQLLKSSLEARINEVTEYQVNIDNYRLAIKFIEDDVEMQPFKSQLQHLLESSILEQRKAQIMLDVVKSQLE